MAAGGEPQLLSDLDIPLMQGFQEQQDSRVVFDTPSGRIIEVRAIGPKASARILDYYQLVLPSLSWKIYEQANKQFEGQNDASPNQPGLTARRDHEILTIKVQETAGGTMVYFSLSPE